MNPPSDASLLPRVVHVGNDLNGRGGMSAVLRDLAGSPLASRFRFAFVTTWRWDAGRRWLVPTFLVGVLRLVVACLRPGGVVVHVHTAVRGSWYRKAICVPVARALGRPVVLQVHAGAVDLAAFWAGLSPLRRRLLRAGLGRANRVLTVSRAGAEALEQSIGFSDVGVVPNPAPATRIIAGSSAGTGGSDVRVLYLGGFEDPAKGGDVLLEALPRLSANGPHLLVELAGPGDLPGAVPSLPSDGTRVEWLGWLEGQAKQRALGAADLVVFPSVSEGMPMALLEAMAAGRAIVATRTGGMAELLTDGTDAVVVPARDPDALAGAVRTLAGDPQQRAALGAAARDRAQRLSHEEVYEPLAGVYEELLTPGSPERGPSGGTRRGLLVCSPGGHLQQMLALRPAWHDLEVTWVTLRGSDSEHILAGDDVVFGHGPTNRSLTKLARNLVLAWRVVGARRPDVILSTGAGLAVAFFLVGRLRGARLVYVESLTRTTGLSLTGRLVARLADEVFVQWPAAADGRARYAGGNIL